MRKGEQAAISGTPGMRVVALISAWCVMMVPSAVSAGWTDSLRLTLANYAYYKSTNMPQDFTCQSLGNAAECCNCWNSKGDHNSGQSNDYCNQPPKCLAKKVEHSGGFKYARLKDPSEINDLLKKWNTPKEMKGDFKSGVYFDSATFMTFDLAVTNKGTGKVEAHVGAARRGKKYVYVGWTYGKAKGDLITPRIRTASSGNCKCKSPYCTTRGYPCPETHLVPNYKPTAGTKKRGFRTSEVIRINDGLLAYAFADASREADRGRRLLRSSGLEEDSDEGSEGSEYVPFSLEAPDDDDPDEGSEGSEYVPYEFDAPIGTEISEKMIEEPETSKSESLTLDIQQAQ